MELVRTIIGIVFVSHACALETIGPSSVPTSSPTVYYLSEPNLQPLCDHLGDYIETMEECSEAAFLISDEFGGQIIPLRDMPCFNSTPTTVRELFVLAHACPGECREKYGGHPDSAACNACLDNKKMHLYPHGCFWKYSENRHGEWNETCYGSDPGRRLYFNPNGSVTHEDVAKSKLDGYVKSMCNRGPPTQMPTRYPTTSTPSVSPTTEPTWSPTLSTTSPSSSNPTSVPTVSPSFTLSPSQSPTSMAPTQNPTTLPTVTPSPPIAGSSSATSTPAIAGGAIVIIFVLVVVVVIFHFRRKRALKRQITTDMLGEPEADSGTFVYSRDSFEKPQVEGRNIDDLIRVALRLNGYHHGLQFGGAMDREEGQRKGFGVFISAILEGTEAYRNPDVEVGLQITRLQGQDLRDCTVPEFVKALEVHQSRVILHVEMMNNEELVHAYNSNNTTTSSNNPTNNSNNANGYVIPLTQPSTTPPPRSVSASILLAQRQRGEETTLKNNPAFGLRLDPFGEE
eukprot:m.194404 g.194404  ORF g.194404 m.194404 type:complete len:512 (-) comp32526_c0_seq1:133-1668(-)